MTDPQPKTETLADQVHRRLAAAIRVGEYAGQNRLPSEADMAARFQVSRPVLRQALARLRASGIVASKRGSGNFVVESTDASLGYDPLRNIPDVQKCLEFRCTIEGQAAAVAARRRSAAQLADIEKMMRDFQEAVEAGASAVEADFAFHLAVARATDNPYVVQSLRALRPHSKFRINRIHTLSTRPSFARLNAVLNEHGRIFAAIRDADPEAALQRMTEHLQAGIDRLFATAGSAEHPS